MQNLIISILILIGSMVSMVGNNENLTNVSSLKRTNISAGVSTTVAGNVMNAVGTVASLLGNKNKSDKSTTHSAIGSNIQINTQNSPKENNKTQNQENQAVNISRDVANANEKVTTYDLDKIKEQDEASYLANEISKSGSKAIGDVSQKIGLKDGSVQKAVLHGALGAIVSKAAGGNAGAGFATGAVNEYVGTKLQNHLAKNTNLSKEVRQGVQQVAALGLGATIGAASSNSDNVHINSQIALNAEKFNRQLHPNALILIRDNAKTYAQKQGITEEQAIAELTAESSRGVSDDFAKLGKNNTARVFLNEIQEEQEDKTLFAELDRNSDEYKNSLINSQYVFENKDLYDAVKSNKNVATQTSDRILASAIREKPSYYKEFGRENILDLYGDVNHKINDYQASSQKLLTKFDKASRLTKRKNDESSHYLSETLASNYPKARQSGEITLSDMYANDNTFTKIAMGNIIEGTSTGLIGKRIQSILSKNTLPPIGYENQKIRLSVGDDVVKNIITGPRGGRATGTRVFDIETKSEIFKRESGGYFVINSEGKQVKVKSPFGNSNKREILQNNRINGADFEEAYKKRLEKNEENVQQQVTLKTSSGIKTRIDFISKSKTGEVKCIECKSSQTAPLTKNQRKAFSEIEKSGATVIGKGKDGFDSGTIIPPTKIEIVRPK